MRCELFLQHFPLCHGCPPHPFVLVCGPDYKFLLWWAQVLPNWTHIEFVISGIAVILFAQSVSTMVRKRRHTGKLNIPLVIPSALIFIFATLVSLITRKSNSLTSSRARSQNVTDIWINAYRAFIVNAKNTEAYLDLITSPAKTILQTGQVGAIILADALMVRLLSVSATCHKSSTTCASQVYRTFVVWNSNKYVVVIPCLTFAATFSECQKFIRK